MRYKLQYLLFACLFICSPVYSQVFSEVATSIPGYSRADADWGDYDNDGDLDILIAESSQSRVYRNEGNDSFIEQPGIALLGVSGGMGKWVDYDNDGDLDIAVSGRYYESGYQDKTTLYTNNGNNSFSEQTAFFFPGAYYGSMSWIDYDNDGDYDLHLTGRDEYNQPFSRLFKNSQGADFTEQTGAGIPATYYGESVWGDYDNDGDLDVLLTGMGENNEYIGEIFENNGDNTFSKNTSVHLPEVEAGSVSWGDYDNDGDLDILLSGNYRNNRYSGVYKNNGDKSFTELSGNFLPDVRNSSVAWGDYDIDGDLDILITGDSIYVYPSEYYVSRIFRNDGDDTFSPQYHLNLTDVQNGSADWGDYDGDGDLDILLTGYNEDYDAVTLLYKNNTAGSNLPPGQPGSLSATVQGNRVNLSWSKPSDSQTPQDGLSYNIYLATTTQGTDTRSSHAEIPSGRRMIAERGEIQNNSYTFGALEPGSYYWSVQAIDAGFAGSGFTTEGSFVISFDNSISPAEDQYIPPETDGTTLTVSETETADSRQWMLSLHPGGPYDRTLSGETSTTYTPRIADDSIFYVVCVSTQSGIQVTSNEVKIQLFPFEEQTSVSLEGVSHGSVEWGDYDNDDDLDILMCGLDINSNSISKVYRNNGNNSFTAETGIVLKGIHYGEGSWVDYDGDGYLDILVAGLDQTDIAVSGLYRNNGNNTFTEQTGINFGGYSYCSMDWGDYDNDGDADLLISGRNLSAVQVSKIFRNNSNNSFTEMTGISLAGADRSDCTWEDFDRDGDLDIMIAGYNTSLGAFSRLYRNEGSSVFTDLGASGIAGVYYCKISWGDYNDDERPDILVSGYNGGSHTTLYKNTGSGTFAEQAGAGITGIFRGDTDWGDVDNDGDLDILLSGYNSTVGMVSEIYVNDGGNQFHKQSSNNFPVAQYSSVEWADYDDDLDLDILVSGYNGTRITRIFQNLCEKPNTPPNPPRDLRLEVNGTDVTFSWYTPEDNETFRDGLSYDIRIGTSSGASDIKQGAINSATGFRKLTEKGNVGSVNSWTLKNQPANSTFYWSVQTIDHGYLASEVIAERAFSACFTETGYSYDGDGTPYLGDYDGDGDLDILIGSSSNTTIYRNDISQGGGIVDIGTAIPDIYGGDSDFAWGDYDNDGDLDFACNYYAGEFWTKVYRNDNGTFIDIDAGMEGTWMGTLSWIDYDNDGDLDLAVYGNHENSDDGEPLGLLYRNDGNDTFTDSELEIEDARRGSISVGDYNNDGYSDILTCGYNLSQNIFTSVLRNNAGSSFTNIDAGIVGYSYGGLSWGDYDSDGDLDIFITGGLYGGGGSTQILQNQGDETFLDIGVGIPGGDWTYQSTAEWGDYDNDGDLDLLTFLRDIIIRNDGNNKFTSVNIGFEIYAGKWGDVDNDGDLDIVANNTIYLNDTENRTSAPFTPEGLQAVVSANQATLSWDPADDDLTPSAGLTYNVVIGSSPGAGDILTAMVEQGGYQRAIPAMGNANTNTFKIIRDLPIGTYYWRVQSVDNTYNASQFSEEQSFDINPMFTNILDDWQISYEGFWGDYDNDGDLDLLASSVLRNDGNNNFTTVSINIYPGENYQWVDYDNDGDLDVLSSDSIYRNDGNNVFTNTGFNFVPSLGLFNTGDYDADGDLDIVSETGIYRNDKNNLFTRIEDEITGIYFFDYDNDSDLDIFNMGSVIYRNDGDDQFTDINANIVDLIYDAVSFADYDSDNDLDILLVGQDDAHNNISKIYRNTGNDQFVDIHTNIRGYNNGYGGGLDILWGDHNNDGFIDVIISGYNNGRQRNLLYLNKLDGTFTEVRIDDIIERMNLYNVGDIDQDGDLDAGTDEGIFRNNTNPGFEAPSVLSKLSSELKGLDYLVYWDRPDDAKGAGYSYNLRIGTSPGGHEIKSGIGVAGFGNVPVDTSWLIHNLEPGTYYWSVQAVNQKYNKGPWAQEQSFLITDVSPDFTFDIVCQREHTSFTDLSVTTDTIIRWRWDFDDGTTSGVQHPVHLFQSAGTFDVSLWVYSQSGDSTERVRQVIVNLSPDASFSVLPVCKDQPSVLENHSVVNGTTIDSWVWDFGNGEQSYIQNSIEKIYVNSDTARLTIFADNGCWDADTQLVIVAAYPDASPSLSPGYSNIFCEGDSAVLNVAFHEDYSYQWKINDVNISYATEPQLTIHGPGGSYSAEVVNPVASCTSMDNIHVTVNPPPSPPVIELEGSAEFCGTDSVMLRVEYGEGYSYSWKKDGGPLHINSNELTVSKTGGYSLTILNQFNCSSEARDTIDILALEHPSKPVIQGTNQTAFCTGESLQLSYDILNSGEYCIWKKDNSTIESYVNQISIDETGDYHLEIVNDIGCPSPLSNIRSITFSNKPALPALSIGQDTLIEHCPDEIIEIAITNSNEDYSYLWYHNGEVISDLEKDGLNGPMAPGNYQVKASDQGCESELRKFTHLWKDAPDKPAIFANNGPVVYYLFCENQNASTYQWYYDGDPIPGASDYFYVANQNLGTYQLEIGEDDKECPIKSNLVTIPEVQTGLPSNVLAQMFKIYPNPNNGVFFYEFSHDYQGRMVLKLISIEGKTISNEVLYKNTYTLKGDIQIHSAPGAYLMILETGQNVYVERVLVR
ncbi:MAG: T9SS type A sorting domain-containing protein [Bacteroidetes bacterium]|nr:T9SS type A sorting domain-containing protein [Bacteroidota bacterium]